MMNDKFRIHLISGDGLHREQQEADGPKDRTHLLKYAIFYLTVAAILIVANQTAKDSAAPTAQPQSAANLQIYLSITSVLSQNRVAGNKAGAGAYVVRFLLRNQGAVSIFYPASPKTNRPMGHVAYRIDPRSDWKLLSPDLSASGPDELKAADIAWIEVPPGGWADGEYVDAGSPVGEHAYELDLKITANGKLSPLLSTPYSANADLSNHTAEQQQPKQNRTAE